MAINGKHLGIFVVLLSAAVFFTITTGFSNHFFQPNKGDIEGYVFPKEAKPRVIVAVPHPQHPEDTIHRSATPNAAGYFKLKNIPIGSQMIIYEPNDQTYRTTSKMAIVIVSQTVNAGSVTLERR